MPEDEMHSILDHCHTLACGGHFGGQRTAAKVLQSGFYWPSLFKDAHQFVSICDKCQRMGNISRKDEPPMHPILEVELFDLWGIDFMGPFPASYNNLYIFLAVDYVSKWVERFLHAQMMPRLWHNSCAAISSHVSRLSSFDHR